MGGDRYEAVLVEDDWPREAYALRRNGITLATLDGTSGASYPNVSLQHLAGHVVWEFSNMETQTLLVDGEDVREIYGLDAAFRPYELGGKLIFVGQRGLRRFIVYDGQQLGPTCEGIAVAHCCEGTLTSVQSGSGRYV
ncbi:MAG: hypothetical protein ACLFU8_17195, partial [Anaerolineales bacterium]